MENGFCLLSNDSRSFLYSVNVKVTYKAYINDTGDVLVVSHNVSTNNSHIIADIPANHTTYTSSPYRLCLDWWTGRLAVYNGDKSVARVLFAPKVDEPILQLIL